MKIEAASALRLVGPPRERGAAQARLRPDTVDAVRSHAMRRVAELAKARALGAVRDYLDRQLAFARLHCAPEWEELEGLATAFELDASDQFATLHGAAIAGLADDGCTAWAATHAREGALLAKNRDIDGALRPLQQVMLHVDAAQPMRAVLVVGSLGAPGAYSSGMNRAGLAVADTAIHALAHHTGWLRYFAMTRLLWSCASVDEALDFLRTVPHAGGGSLLLADRHGAVAAVEIPDGSARIECAPLVLRTNHFTSVEDRARPPRDANETNSEPRLHWLRASIERDGIPDDIVQSAQRMAAHGGHGALCRHAEAGVRTVSTAIYRLAARELVFAPDYPCMGQWQRYALPADV